MPKHKGNNKQTNKQTFKQTITMTKMASIQLNRGKYTYHLQDYKILHLPTEYIEVFWITHTRLRLFLQTTLTRWAS